MLVSGSGSNLQAIIDARTPDDAYEICLVLSDRADAGGLQRAADAGIPTAVVAWSGDREAFTSAVCDAVEDAGASVMVLAGFMRILGPEAIGRFGGRIVNIHPSLLPAFPGRGAVPEALAYGVHLTGVTVHFVDEEVDHGPIISQHAVRVAPDDTEETLHARIQEVEHLVYPEAVRALVEGRLRLEGRTVIWSE